MAIVRWNPFRDMMNLRSEMNRLFDDFRSESPYESEGLTYSPWQPAVDIYEDTESVIIKADLPDLDQKSVTLRVENRNLLIKGERKLEKEEKKENYHRIERAYGSFQRSFTLPETVDVEKISAETKNGVLSIVLPKKPETKPKQIDIKVS